MLKHKTSVGGLSISVVKNGSKGGRQRYKCKDCKKSFGDTYGTVLYKSKLSIEKWKTLLAYTLHNDSVRFIRKETGMNFRTILYNRHRIAELLKVLLANLDNFESIVQADEYYIPLSFKDMKDPEYFIGTLGRMPNTRLSRDDTFPVLPCASNEFLTTLHLLFVLCLGQYQSSLREKGTAL